MEVSIVNIYNLKRLKIKVVVPEWLSGMTRNHVGFAPAGSNRADHEIYLCFYFFLMKGLTILRMTWAGINLH